MGEVCYERMMDGCTRSKIFPGLRVAIVLKEDQPTGRRTIGEVGRILTSDTHHPHGIKVRLTDGQVGRVQEILGPAPKPPVKQPAGPPEMVVLAVLRGDGTHYARKLAFPSGEFVFSLGLDATGNTGHPADALLTKLLAGVVNLKSPPRLLIEDKLNIAEKDLNFHGYVCSAANVNDQQAHLWTWTGWLTVEDIERIGGQGGLSEDSVMLYKAWRSVKNSER